jgi:hypothetical protein
MREDTRFQRYTYGHSGGDGTGGGRRWFVLVQMFYNAGEVAKLLNASDVVLLNYGLHYCQPARRDADDKCREQFARHERELSELLASLQVLPWYSHGIAGCCMYDCLAAGRTTAYRQMLCMLHVPPRCRPSPRCRASTPCCKRPPRNTFRRWASTQPPRVRGAPETTATRLLSQPRLSRLSRASSSAPRRRHRPPSPRWPPAALLPPPPPPPPLAMLAAGRPFLKKLTTALQATGRPAPSSLA